MLIPKRLVVWLIEMSCELLLLTSLLMFMFWVHEPIGKFLKSLPSTIYVIAYVFMWRDGYLLTTGILRLIWSNRKPWLHPAISVVLFSIHVLVFYFLTGGFDRIERLAIEAGGACIVFACTFAGGNLLRRWENAGHNNRAAGSPRFPAATTN